MKSQINKNDMAPSAPPPFAFAKQFCKNLNMESRCN